jgi:hypothetical protein
VGKIEFNIYQNAKESPINMKMPSVSMSTMNNGYKFFLIDVEIHGQPDNIRLAYTPNDYRRDTNFRLVDKENPIDSDYVFIKRTSTTNILNNFFGKKKVGGNKSKHARSKKHKKNKKSKNTRRKK